MTQKHLSALSLRSIERDTARSLNISIVTGKVNESKPNRGKFM